MFASESRNAFPTVQITMLSPPLLFGNTLIVILHIQKEIHYVLV